MSNTIFVLYLKSLSIGTDTGEIDKRNFTLANTFRLTPNDQLDLAQIRRIITDAFNRISVMKGYQHNDAGAQLVSACDSIRINLKQESYLANYKIVVIGYIGNLMFTSYFV